MVLANSLSLRRRVLMVLGMRTLHPGGSTGTAAAVGPRDHDGSGGSTSQTASNAAAVTTTGDLSPHRVAHHPSACDDDVAVGKSASLQLVSNPLWQSSTTRRG